ncbi:hypothetical protein F441_06841 [Phytophthora nicotianae CJ01A1]|uniref:Uncharacterized protein n=4 Tax=Phytophthora nicotianae TaxID=4792 RepID=W2ZIR8_PHYNI|nr:hypothetical protein L915_21846 [Phytophthora nicotianae]ETP19023.1 hypothetical protein F441_06841 [Phytophthora nicotianae CJ01A1]ETP46950.1 hypothetical protein F442_06877 [Phytophthora nicotianae P10297]ETL24139.1 hypothetical protein L916_21848 [Phytophthora nicotianae]ETL95722.1 hypothetical protein L917_06520 [Phytophthora nicotianae]
MAPKYVWTSLGKKLETLEVNRWLDRFRSFRTPTTHAVCCQLCPINYDDHAMRYQMLECASATCKVVLGDGCE